MKLTEAQRKHLRGLAHGRKPLVTIGDAGLSESVLSELEHTLARHELIKVRVRAGDRNERDALIAMLVKRSRAIMVQRVGHVLVLYRAHPDKPRITLP